ncbi:hypothetical protein [Paenibacillus alkalitolerans]|uniref:hypothetical protein n=1 Tax=Paenibacillus alkalitolerans TaxID=2799335 RepID=UPI002D80717E|nr:hypothetical protein [Paenibacillus alkalitolerans]
MFDIRYEKLSLHPELQIVQADVAVTAEGERLIDEPLCIDVGLPALLASAFEDTAPDRFADPAAEWRKMPFFVCGCGDPECRGYSFAVRHEGDRVVWTEIDETSTGVREGNAYRIPLSEYRRVVAAAAEQFLAYVEPLDYRPLYAETADTVRKLLKRLKEEA